MNDQRKIWTCKIGGCAPGDLPNGADGPMRIAVAEAYKRITGKEADFCFSGWGAKLSSWEQAVEKGDGLPTRAEVAADIARLEEKLTALRNLAKELEWQ